MDLPLALQYLLIALAVLASAAVTVHKQFPGAARSLRAGCALPLLREGRPHWMRRLGRAIAPPVGSAAKSCGDCSGCEPEA